MSNLLFIFYVIMRFNASITVKINTVKDMKAQILKIAKALEKGTINTEQARILLLGLLIVSVSDDDIQNVAVDKASDGKYTWNFDYGVDMAKWMRDKLINH